MGFPKACLPVGRDLVGTTRCKNASRPHWAVVFFDLSTNSFVRLLARINIFTPIDLTIAFDKIISIVIIVLYETIQQPKLVETVPQARLQSAVLCCGISFPFKVYTRRPVNGRFFE